MNIKVAAFTVSENTMNMCQLNGVPCKKTCLEVWSPGKTYTSLLSYRDKNMKILYGANSVNELSKFPEDEQ